MGGRVGIHNFLVTFFFLMLLLIRNRDPEGMRQKCFTENSKVFRINPTATTPALPLALADACEYFDLLK